MADDARDIHTTLDLAMRVGEMLLANGAGAADTAAAMDDITHHLGLYNVTADVTFTTLVLTYQRNFDETAYSRVRQVKHREIDYDDLVRVDHLVRDLLSDKIDRDEARQRMAQISSTGHVTPRWAITLSWGITGAAISALIGGDWIVMMVAFVAAVSIEVVQRLLARWRLPSFYLQIGGALVATLIAVAVAATDIPVSPSLVISASIVMLLAGLGFIGAIQDALTGYYVTATARILEVMIATAGILVGVSGGLSVADLMGVEFSVNPGAASLSRLPVTILAAAVTAASFAFSAYAPRRSLAPIAVIAGLAAGIFTLTVDQEVDRTWAAGIAAVAVGIVAYTAANRVRVPPLVIVVSCIVPLLPGLSIYRSLAQLSNGNTNGILAMVTATGIAIALASGVILGEYIAQPLRRQSRRLEQRLSGPRLVGPLRHRSRRS